MLFDAPQEEIQVSIVQLTVDGVWVSHSVDRQLSFVDDSVALDMIRMVGIAVLLLIVDGETIWIKTRSAN